MKESVDKQLKEHIIRVFDNYDDNGADLGWLELRKKHPKKSFKRLYWWSSAAVILLASASLYLMNTGDHQDPALSSIKRIPRAGNDTLTTNLPESVRPSNPASALENRTVRVAKPASEPVIRVNSQPVTNHPANKPVAGNPAAANTIIDNAPISAASKPVTNNPIPDNLITSLPDNRIADTIGSLIARSFTPMNRRENLITSLPDRPITNITDNSLANIKDRLTDKVAEETPVSEETHRKKLELSFYAGAFVNYAEGSSNSMNVGAGVSSGISLTKRLTLVAGLALAKNTLVFKNELPNTSYVAFVALDQRAANSYLSGTVPQISKLEAQLLNLDFPINIKYSLSREPNKVFVTAGVSSFTYLNEAYHYSYNNRNNGTNFFSPSQDAVINKNFGKLDLAQTLNFSFGLTHTARLQNIVVEPFIKYPIGALGSQNIRFGSAGINIKLSVNPADNQKK